MPPHVTAATGLDALIHAVEAFTSKNANSLSDVLARQAMKLIYGHIRKAFANGEDPAARAQMLEGSLLAGMAFANAGVNGRACVCLPDRRRISHSPRCRQQHHAAPVMEFNMLGTLRSSLR